MTKEPKPWNQANENGEFPGSICCMSATGGKCYEHNPLNYPDGKKYIAKQKLKEAVQLLGKEECLKIINKD